MTAQIETIRTKVMKQKQRIVVSDALRSGRCKTWDYVPQSDYSDTYVRSANSHEVIDRKVRIAAKGHVLPQNK